MQNIDSIVIDHYRMKELYVRGGMAEIYLAEDLQTGQPVAVKVVRSSDIDYSERFRREVKTIASLHHKHILPALSYGEYSNWYYMVTPFISHGTLANRLERGNLTPEEAGELQEQIVDALQAAHDLGVVHRDIKPSNVLMRDDHYVYLADFGLVKSTGAAHSLTQSGYLIGTPEYMAPELVERPATPASDTYALGILVYQMLTGQVPFKGESPVSVVWKHLKEQPEPPSKLNPAIPYEIEQVILGALEKNPQKRFQTPREFQQAYQRALYGGADETMHIGAVSLAPAPVEVEVIPASEVKIPGMQPFADPGRLILLGLLVLILALILLFGLVVFGPQYHSPLTPTVAPPAHTMQPAKKHSP